MRRIEENHQQQDAEIVHRFRGGEIQAFDELVRRYTAPVYNAAFRIVGNEEDAKDAAQSTFFRAWEKLPTFDDTRPFFSWLYKIALNEALQLVRKRKRNRESVSAPADVADEAVSPYGSCLGAETDTALHRALPELKPDLRLAIILRHFLDCSYEEMAEILDIPSKTVKSRLYEARRTLQALLAKAGFGAAQPGFPAVENASLLNEANKLS